MTYHDSCHLKRTLNVSEQPRELLTKAGYEIAEMYEADMCCGMGGSYSLKLPEISAPILERKLANIKNTDAPAGGDGLSRLRPCRFAAAWTRTARPSRSSTPRSGWRKSWNSGDSRQRLVPLNCHHEEAFRPTRDLLFVA